jgi:hypothetical protein
VIASYVARLPGAVKEGMRLYSTHSLRATTATLLLDAGVDIRKVQELLGHRHVTTTQIYDKRRRTTKKALLMTYLFNNVAFFFHSSLVGTAADLNTRQTPINPISTIISHLA